MQSIDPQTTNVNVTASAVDEMTSEETKLDKDTKATRGVRYPARSDADRRQIEQRVG
jgi:outer membrane murein-binding lipoprotein Lpp